MPQRSTRRRFLKTSAAIGAGYLIADHLHAKESKSPNERIAFACIGTSGKGHEDSDCAGKNGDVVAVCDVDEGTLKKAGERFPNAKKFYDFREMLDKMGGKIDAVTVSTPDHIHAPAAAMAMRQGIHCFVQKPLTHSLYEARVLTELAREKKLATQMGNQGSAASNLRKAAALIRAGVLGAVSEIHISTDRPIWPQGVARPKPSPAPSSVKWDLWLGPAPKRPWGRLDPLPKYPQGVNPYHPFCWRGWWDFGTGALGDIACHALNMSFRALDLRNPVAVQAETSGHNKDSFPAWSIITFEFAATAARPALKLVWYDGGKRPAKELFEGVRWGGCLVVGEKGKMVSSGGGPEGFSLSKGLVEPEVHFPVAPGQSEGLAQAHFAEWARAIRGGPAAMSNFVEYAGPLTETVLMGNLAVWVADQGKGQKVLWDAKNQRVTNIAGLEHLIHREYRKGYTL